MDGTTIVNNDTLMQAVRESALLADLTIGMWNAERTDRQAGHKLKSDAGAVDSAGRFIKNILAGADGKLKDVRSAFQTVRTTHYSLTLPWVSDPHALRQSGPRLLTHALFDRYIKEVQAKRREASVALNEFLAEYPGLVAQAQANLGNLADPDYPGVDEIRGQFRVHMDFTPLPDGAQFRGMPADTVERLADALEKRQERMLSAATQIMWGEAKDRVGHIVERLSDPENKFKASTVDAVRDLLTTLPGWNLTRDPRVAEIVAGIHSMLDGVGVKELRDNNTVRAEVASKANALAQRMQSWGV